MQRSLVRIHERSRRKSKEVNETVPLILIVHVDDNLVVSGRAECDELHRILNDEFPINNLREVHALQCRA